MLTTFRIFWMSALGALAGLSTAHALTFEVNFRGEDQTLRLHQEVQGERETIGAFTLRALEALKGAEKIQTYVAFENGVQSINDFANPILFPSETSLKAYGWCYWLDGVLLEELTDAAWVTEQTRSLQWAWAYALYEDGEWKNFCIPESSAFKPHAD